MKINFSLLLLVVGNLIHCQDHEKDNDSNLEEVLEELEVISDKLKGYETIQRKQDEIMDKLMELHRDMEHIKGLIQETQQCPRGDELQHSHNVSAADDCSQGSHHCGHLGICEDTSFGFTCSCPSGFTWDGSDCADIDECYEGKDECVPNAKCKNSIGSYSCSCNKPFKGDGKKSCDFQCTDRDDFVEGLGCLRVGYEPMTFWDSSDTCQEEGGRLLQHFDSNHLKGFEKIYPVIGQLWVGVYDGKWTSDESPVPKDLLEEGYGSIDWRRCGVLTKNHLSESYEAIISSKHCSAKSFGLCQFEMH